MSETAIGEVVRMYAQDAVDFEVEGTLFTRREQVEPY